MGETLTKKNRKMEEAPAAATVGSRPVLEDVIFEILVRIKDVAALFRCAMACKRWARLVADPYFLRRRWPPETAHASAFMAGFFAWGRYGLPDSTYGRSLVPGPSRSSVFGPSRLVFESFFPGNEEDVMRGGGLLEGAVPLVARHGLLLVRLASAGDPVNEGVIVRLAVCNLLAGTCDVLPPLSCLWTWSFNHSGYAVLTGADLVFSNDDRQRSSPPPGYSAFFKVLIVGTDTYPFVHNLHEFSSAEPRWRTRCGSLFDSRMSEEGVHLLLAHSGAALHRGTAHWLNSMGRSDLHTLDVDVQTCRRLSLTKIPIPMTSQQYQTYNSPQLSVVASGALALLLLQRAGLRLDIWTRQDGGIESGDGGVARWSCTSVIELKLPKHVHIEGGVQLFLFGEKSGTLIVKDNHRHIYAADLETGAMEELMDCGWISRSFKVVPFDMDWLTLIASRLLVAISSIHNDI